MDSALTFTPIGIIHSCFTEKFGIPRQPGLATAARATLEILPPYDRDEAFKDLDGFSHLWILFVFHGNPEGKWHPTVRPPRLGGNRRTGVFTTRSGFRPNRIGMSPVVLKGINRKRGKLCLALSGIDILDRTPVLDIKPYLPYADSIPDATGSFAAERPQASLAVEFTDQGREACTEFETTYPGLTELVIQVLRADPRPAYMGKRSQKTEFGLRLYDLNIRWSVRQSAIIVHSVEKDAGKRKAARGGDAGDLTSWHCQ